jgi:hypothetical protein
MSTRALLTGITALFLAIGAAHAEEPFPLTRPMRSPPRQSFDMDGKALPLPIDTCKLEIGIEEPPYGLYAKSNCWAEVQYFHMTKKATPDCPSEVKNIEQVDKATVYVQLKDTCDAREKTIRFALEDTKDLLITNVEAY